MLGNRAERGAGNLAAGIVYSRLRQYEIREIETLSPFHTTTTATRDLKTQHHQELLKALSFDFIYINKSRKQLITQQSIRHQTEPSQVPGPIALCYVSLA